MVLKELLMDCKNKSNMKTFKHTEILICPKCNYQSLENITNGVLCNNCNNTFLYYNDSALVLVNDNHYRNNYGKFLVTNYSYDKEARWSKEFEIAIPDGNGFLLDYACGGGKRKWCEAKGYKYIGMDYYNDYGVGIIAHGMNIPLKNNSISCVTSNAVMEHIPNPLKACLEIYRVLKPSGIYVGSTAFLQPFHEISHFNMSHLGIKLMLEEAGFHIICISPFKRTGLQSIIRTLIGHRFLSKIIVLPFMLFENTIMLLRKFACLLYLKIYKNNERKKTRILEFLREEKFRFTSGFYTLQKNCNFLTNFKIVY